MTLDGPATESTSEELLRLLSAEEGDRLLPSSRLLTMDGVTVELLPPMWLRSTKLPPLVKLRLERAACCSCRASAAVGRDEVDGTGDRRGLGDECDLMCVSSAFLEL